MLCVCVGACCAEHGRREPTEAWPPRQTRHNRSLTLSSNRRATQLPQSPASQCVPLSPNVQLRGSSTQ